MKTYRLLLAVLACTALLPLLPAPADAQVTFRITHRGVLGIMTEVTMTPGETATRRVIVDVVPGSPAAQAGVQRGDTLISIGGQAATDEVMRTPFEPGDTVVLRIRRDGRDQDLTVIAGERTPQFQAFTVNALPDSVRRQIAEIMDAVRLEADTLRMRALTIERMRGDSAVIFRFGDDSTRVVNLRPLLLDAWANADSLRAQAFRMDSTRFHLYADTLRARELRDRSRFMFEMMPRAEGGVLVLPSGDTVRTLPPSEIFTRGMSVGLRAVAGAELSELNPGLAEYFGVAEGVLVLDAREGTPAARAGVRAGDVIVQVNATPVASIAEFRQAFDAAQAGGGAIRLRVLRHGQPVELSLSR